MIMQAVDYCQQEQKNDFKTSNKIEPSWSEVGQELMRWARFLENFYSFTVQNIIDKNYPVNKDIWIELEKTKGEVAEAHAPLAELVVEGGLRPQSLTTLLQCLHIDISIDNLFHYIISNHTADVAKMEKLVSCLVAYEKSDIKLSEEVVAAVEDRAAAFQLPPPLHISLLSLSGKKQICDDGDMLGITKFSMQLLKNEWSDIEMIQQLSEDDLQTEEKRREIFENCLRETASWQKKKALVDIICSWPNFTMSSDDKKPCYQLMEKLLTESDDQDENNILVKMLMKRSLLSEEEIRLLIENGKEVAVANILCIILLTKNKALNEMIPSLLQKQKFASCALNLSDELIEELLQNNMFLKLVSTVAYTPILHYIINCESDSASGKTFTLDWAVMELTKANYLAEAGQLKLLHMGVPASLIGFSECIKSHKRLSYKPFH